MHTLGVSTPELLTAAGIAVSVVVTLIAVSWRLSARLATLATKDDLLVLATKADVTTLGDRLDKRIDELAKEVHEQGQRVAALEGAVGYARQRAL